MVLLETFIPYQWGHYASDQAPHPRRQISKARRQNASSVIVGPLVPRFKRDFGGRKDLDWHIRVFGQMIECFSYLALTPQKTRELNEEYEQEIHKDQLESRERQGQSGLPQHFRHITHSGYIAFYIAKNAFLVFATHY